MSVFEKQKKREKSVVSSSGSANPIQIVMLCFLLLFSAISMILSIRALLRSLRNLRLVQSKLDNLPAQYQRHAKMSFSMQTDFFELWFEKICSVFVVVKRKKKN